MKSNPVTQKRNLFLLVLGLFFNVIFSASAADFNVTTPGFSYTINGNISNPTLTLTRGVTYTFLVNAASNHPFKIVSSLSGTAYNDGVMNNNIATGTITFKVPDNAPATLYYICSIHFFGGTINIIDPPAVPAPVVKLISISLTTNNVVMTSTGTNGWTAIPEFTSNLFSPTWLVVPSYTNTFANGTNTTVFGRLEAICGPNVFLRVKNTQNP